MTETRVIIAGGREFSDYPRLVKECDSILSEYEHVNIVSGMARGADQMGERYAKDKGYKVTRFPSQWDLYGKSAGYIRNSEMANYAVKDNSNGVLIAFWDGNSRGTKHMIDLAKKK